MEDPARCSCLTRRVAPLRRSTTRVSQNYVVRLDKVRNGVFEVRPDNGFRPNEGMAFCWLILGGKELIDHRTRKSFESLVGRGRHGRCQGCGLTERDRRETFGAGERRQS